MCVPWELNPQPYALLTQCSTTEPQEHSNAALSRAGGVIDGRSGSDEGHSRSGRSVFQAVSVRSLLAVILSAVRAAQSRGHALQRPALQVRLLRPSLRRSHHPQQPHPHTHRGEAFQVSNSEYHPFLEDLSVSSRYLHPSLYSLYTSVSPTSTSHVFKLSILNHFYLNKYIYIYTYSIYKHFTHTHTHIF